MNILSTIQKSFLEGYATSDLSITTMFLCIGFTSLIALYICIVYRLMNKNSFFNRSFHLSLFALSVITAAIILTIQSNIVVSLGMVGALSIVRFRTAIKDPMDLVFLFWSISTGIICGAGFAMIAVIASIVLSIGIILFFALPAERESMILVINMTQYNEESITSVLDEYCRMWKIRARNITVGNTNLAIEVKVKKTNSLLRTLSDDKYITSVSLVEHNGDITV